MNDTLVSLRFVLRFRMFLIFSLIVTAGPLRTQAQVFQQTNGPYGINSRLLIEDKNNRLFVVSDFGDMYMTADQGVNWSLRRTRISSVVFTAAVDSSNAIIVAELPGGLYRSTDNGVTWQGYNEGLESVSVTDLLVHPTGRLFAATSAGISFRSPGDPSWSTSLSGSSSARSLTLQHDTTILAGMTSGYVTRSVDNGASWDSIPRGPNSVTVSGIIADGLGGIYICSSGGVFSTSDNGVTWQTGGPAAGLDPFFRDLAGNIYAATLTGFYRAENQGQSWSLVPGLPTSFGKCGLGATDGSLWAGTTSGLFLTTDEGLSWDERNYGLRGSDVRGTTADNAGNIYVGTASGIYKSTDKGESWQTANAGLNELFINAIMWSSGGYLLAGTSSAAYKSTDAGSSWSVSDNGFTANPSHFVENSLGWIFAGAQGQGILRSTDQGQNWTVVNNGIGPLSVQELKIDRDDNLYARYPVGVIYVSTNSGDNWNVLNTNSEPVSAIAGDANGTILFGTSSGMIFRSTNGGISFTDVTPDPLVAPVTAIAHSPQGAFFALAWNGIHVSHDNGVEWEHLDSSMSAVPQRIMFDSIGHAYVGTTSRGLYKGGPFMTSSLDFGVLMREDTAYRPVRVFNTAGTSTEFTFQMETGIDFSILNPLPVTVPAGEYADFVLMFHPQGFGEFNDTLHVSSVLGNEQVFLRGMSPAPVLAADPSLTLGPIALADTAVGFITLRNLSPVNPLSVTARSNMAPVFFMEAFSPFEIAGGGIDTIVIRFNVESFTPDGYGTHLDTLTIVSDGGTVKVPLVGLSPRPAIEIIQSPVFEMTAVEDTSSSTLILTNTSVNTLVIDSIKTQTPAFEVSWVPVPVTNQDTLQIQLRFLPTSFGWQTDTVRIWSNAEESVMSFEILAECPFPVLIVEPESISFENVLKDSTEELFFIIIDSSISKLRIDSLWTNTPYFDVTKTPPGNYVLAWDTMQIAVRFTPDSSGEFSDSLYIANNSGVPVFRIHLFGNAFVSSVSRLNDVIPTEYQLFQNYPNPFNPSTTLRFGVPVKSLVRIAVYDILGRQVALLADQELDPGYYERVWNGDVSSGLYFCRIEATSGNRRFIDVKKLILLK